MSKPAIHSALRLSSIAAIAAAVFCFSISAHAATQTTSGNGLTRALAHDDTQKFLGDENGKGFSLGGSFFSGRLSGNDPISPSGVSGLGVIGDFSTDRFAELEGDRRVYALLIDGTYDFDYDFGTGLPISPYLGGGLGVAVYDDAATRTNLGESNGDMVPLFRVGGGVVYKLGMDWDLSLNYKAGFSGPSTSDRTFTGRGQEQVDLQVLDLGMKYRF